MRLTAEVDVTNRLLPSFNLKQKSRGARMQLSVGNKPGSNEICMMICAKQDRAGQFYKLKDNIEKCFTKFASEGKATIRFTDPPHDICLSKADPIQLKAFLGVMRLGCQGASLENVKLPSLAPASSKQLEKLKTKLKIKSRKEYPITTDFPKSLEYLLVNGCTLRKIDSRILNLRNLQVLDLSDNNIQKLPENFSGINQLQELHLSQNNIEEVTSKFCECENLRKSLKLLDLCDNKLKFLHSYFGQLEALVTLKLDRNQLVCLPSTIGNLPRLTYISACDNKLTTLPASFTRLRLSELNLFGNPFMDEGLGAAKMHLQNVLSLMELSARSIKNHKVPYTEEDVGIVGLYLNSSKLCLCGSYCFKSFIHCIHQVRLVTVSTSVTLVDHHGRSQVPVEVFFCSLSCYQGFLNNPVAFFLRK